MYETIRVFRGKAFLFEYHITRLLSSAKGIFLEIPYSKAELIKHIKKTYIESRLDDAFIRILITRGEGAQGLLANSKPDVIIIVNKREFSPLEKVSITISKIRRVNKSAIDPKIKSLNYLNSLLARADAKTRKFDEAILLTDAGIVTEATTSNIFLVKHKKLYTPSVDSGILEGSVRKAIIDNFPVVEKELRVKDILEADEIFLSGTVNFITCVSRVDSKKLTNFEYAKKVHDKLMNLAASGTKLY